MSVVAKIGRTYDCFEKFRSSCDNKEFRQLVDIFFPMFYEEKNNCKLHIYIYKIIEDRCVVKDKWFLEETKKYERNNFVVKPSYWKDEPQLIFEDRTNRIPRTIIMFNLNAMIGLKIDKYLENFHTVYKISFAYADGKHYEIHISIM